MPTYNTPLSTRRAVVLAKIESTYNVDPVPVATTDAILVSAPAFSVDPTVLIRDFVRDDMSPMGRRVGRMLAKMSFGVEVRSNGLTNSGNTANASRTGRMLRACGFSENGITGTGTVGAARNGSANTVNPAWVAGGASTKKGPIKYRVTCVLAGASAAAKVRVTTPDFEEFDTGVILASETISFSNIVGSTLVGTWNLTNPLAPVLTLSGTVAVGDKFRIVFCGRIFDFTSAATTLTALSTLIKTAIELIGSVTDTVSGASSEVNTFAYSGALNGTVLTSGATAFALGGSGATWTPTWAGALVLGDYWEVIVYPTCIAYRPVSTSQESITLYMYFDGLLHKMTGSFGSVSMEANAGEFGRFTFTFTGQYIAPVDSAVPQTAAYEAALIQPPVFELAQLRVDDRAVIVNNLRFDENNTVAPRSSANHSDGYYGVRITGRDPQGGVDPEAELVRDYDWWSKFKASTQVALKARIGQTDGNVIWLNALGVQYSGMSYGDRNGIRVFAAGVGFARIDGDDEIEILFA